MCVCVCVVVCVAMTTIMRDRLQERSNNKRETMTSLDYIVRLTERLRRLLLLLLLLLLAFFSHGSKAREEEVAGNGADYNCDVSTTAASRDNSDTESTTSADSDRLNSHTSPTADNDVDLINPLPADRTHYICMMAAGAGLNLPQARLPQPTVFDGTTPPFQEWIQETSNFLSINNYELARQMDCALQSDREISLQEVTDSTTRGRERREDLTANERALDLLQDEYMGQNGFEALRLLRLRCSGGQMLQNYQLLRELLNPKFTESHQHY